MQRKTSNSGRAWRMFLLLPVISILSGCMTPVWYSGTFIGHTEKAELYSTNGQSFAVAMLKIETTRGWIRSHGGYCWLDVEKNEPWSRAGWTKAILVDSSNTAYSADSYDGKILKVTGETRGGPVYPFAGGPSLQVHGSLKHGIPLTMIGTLRVKNIEVVDSVAMEKWLAARRAATLSKSKMMPPYAGTFVGRAEKGELYLRDGKPFSVTMFTVETTKGEIESTPRFPWKDGWQPTVLLVDSCSTVYRPEKYDGKKLNVTGMIRDGSYPPACSPGGPWLSPVSPPKLGTKPVPPMSLCVERMEIIDHGVEKRVVIARRPTMPADKGSWIGRIERCELRSKDGTVFPIAAFKIEKVMWKKSPPIPMLPVILVDRCYTAWHPSSYADLLVGKKLWVSGTIEDGPAFPFPDGPELFGNIPSGTDARCYGYVVLVHDSISTGE